MTSGSPEDLAGVYRWRMTMLDEIREQPLVARRLLDRAGSAVEAAATAVRERGVDHVVIAARGTSDHAAIYGQYLLGTRNRLVVALAAPSITTLYGIAPRFERALVVGISQSGASPDVVGVVAAARAQGAPTVAITNDPASPLGTTAEYVVDLAAGPERAIAATKTYTAELLAIAMLSTALGPAADAAADAGRANVLDDRPRRRPGGPRRRCPRRWRPRSRSRPPPSWSPANRRPRAASSSSAGATSTRRPANGRSRSRSSPTPSPTRTRRPTSCTGPLALIEPGVPVLAVAPSGVTEPGMTALLRSLRDDHAAELAIVSDLAEVRAIGRWGLAIPTGVPDWLRPIVSIVPGQLHAYHLTRAKGLDPERPRAISKVTRTR